MSFSKFHIAELIFGRIKGTLSGNESKQLNKWIDASDANKMLFERLRDKNSYKTKARLYKQFEKLKRYSSIQEKINREKRRYIYGSLAASIIGILLISSLFIVFHKTETEQKPIIISQTKSIIPGKAVAILKTETGATIDLSSENVLLLSADKTKITHNKNTLAYEESSDAKTREQSEEIYNTLSVPRGGEYKLVLADGTKVWLNAESSIRYPVQFLKSTREVYVSGEAYFEVQPNEKKPFWIHAEGIQVKVLGTSFNIRAYADEGFTQTTLVEGTVAVGKEDKMQAISPSEQFTYNKQSGTSTIQQVDTYLYTSWKDGVFLFNSQTLEQILNDISRWYNVRFVFADDEALKTSVFSGRLRKYDNADGLLSIFEKTGNIIFEKQSDIIYVKPKNK